MPEDMSEYMPEGMSDRMPEDMSEYMPEDMPEDMSDRVPEDMPDRMPEDLPDRMPEDMPEDMPDHMPEDMPDRMSNRMSEDMSDRMPEDLPVRKCINVMVGITRSKVIWHVFLATCDCFHLFSGQVMYGDVEFLPAKTQKPWCFCTARCGLLLSGGFCYASVASMQPPGAWLDTWHASQLVYVVRG